MSRILRRLSLRRLRRALFVLAASVVTPAFAADDPIEQFRPTGGEAFDHSAFGVLLERHVKPDSAGYNRVDYRALAAEHDALDAYLDTLLAASPATLSVDEAHAYWINLYNAKTLDVVLDHYPVESIRRIKLEGGGFLASLKPGPWSVPVVTVDGVELSLDDIEHRIIRPIFEDPMSHYGVNCASVSCPNLMATAYTGANVDALLAESGRQYVNHPRGVEVRRGRIVASKIYSWYADDFGGEDALKAHWTALAEPEKAAAIEAAEIGRYRYDWDLNDIGSAAM